MAQKRKKERSPVECNLIVFWMESNGMDHWAKAKSVDFSESGLSILVSSRIEPRTLVRIKSDDQPDLAGTASVRSCVRNGLNYRIGLEYPGGAKLKVRKQPPPPREL
jgi:hypothetical protein